MTEKQEIFTLLNGKIKLHRSDYNPTSDAVWLAAMPNKTPQTILDVGIGTGGVALCLQNHFPKARITGLDISKQMLITCEANAKLNNYHFELINQNILNWSTQNTYDLVVSNPPYFLGTPTTKNPDAHHNCDLSKWLKRCIARVRPQGYFCTILDVGRLGEAIGTISQKCGEITIIPLFGSKTTAERVLIRAKPGSRSPSVLHPGYPMNYPPILRDGLTMKKILSKILPRC